MLYPYGYWGHDAKTSFWSKLDPNALDKIVENTKGIFEGVVPGNKGGAHESRICEERHYAKGRC